MIDARPHPRPCPELGLDTPLFADSAWHAFPEQGSRNVDSLPEAAEYQTLDPGRLRCCTLLCGI